MLVPVGLVALGMAIILLLGRGLQGTSLGELLKPSAAPAAQGGEGAAAPAGAASEPAAPAAAQPAEAGSKPTESDAAEEKPDGSGETQQPGAGETGDAGQAEKIQQARANIDRSGGAEKTMLTTVYYADGLGNGDTLQPVQVRVPHSVARIAATTEQVLNPPSDLKLYSNVPAGTQVRGVSLNQADGVAVVDLSGEAAQIQGSAAAESFRAALVYSLTEIPGVKAVQLRIEGQPALLHGVEWSAPLSRADVEARGSVKVAPVIEYGSQP